MTFQTAFTRRLCRPVAAMALAVAALGAAVVLNPASAPAQTWQLNRRSGVFPADGGTGSIAVTAESNAVWDVTPTLPSWITVVSGSPWTGSGVLTIAVAKNTGDVRSFDISLPGGSVTVAQASGLCPTTASPAGGSFSASGASSRSFNVSSGGTCFWNPATNASWVQLLSFGGSGGGSVVFNVSANSGSAPRSAAIVAGGALYTVDQDGTGECNYDPSPARYDFPYTGGAGSFDIKVGSSCEDSWSVTSDSPWVTLGSASGSGSGTVTYTVAANPFGFVRSAVLVVQGRPHFVYQAPSPTPGFSVIQPGPSDGQDTSYGTAYYTNGTPDDVTLTFGGSGDAFYNYFRFDVSAGFPAANVSKVEFQFYVTGVPYSSPGLQLHSVNSSWSEASVSKSNAPQGTLYGYVSTPRAGWNSVDVTELYRKWKTGFLPNNGIGLFPTSTENARGFLASAEHPEPGIRPRLVLTYSDYPLNSAISSRQNLAINTATGAGYQLLSYKYATGDTVVSPYAATSGYVPYELPTDVWVGQYMYDYGTRRYSHALYGYRDGFY